MKTQEQKSWLRPTRDETVADKLVEFSLSYYREIPVQSNRGYTIAPQKILRCFRLSDLEKVTLMDLWSYIGDKDYAFPSHSTLAFELGKKGIGSVKAALKSLRDKKFIYWEIGGGDKGPNHYKIPSLYDNAYIILSEMTHYFKNIVLYFYRGTISYENLYGSILDFVCVSKALEMSEVDIYGSYLNTLIRDPKSKNDSGFVLRYYECLSEYVNKQLGERINIDWEDTIINIFDGSKFKPYHNKQTRKTLYL